MAVTTIKAAERTPESRPRPGWETAGPSSHNPL